MKLIRGALLKNRFGKRYWEAFLAHLFQCRCYAEDCGAALNKRGLVLGAYEGCSPGEYKFSPTAEKYDESIGGKLCYLLNGIHMKPGEARIFKNIDKSFYGVAVAALGKEDAKYDDVENLDVRKENIRVAAGLAARCLHAEGTGFITIEEFLSAEAASEAGYLATWKYDELKSKEDQAPRAKLELYCGEDKDGWTRGRIKAEAQNFARQLEETPANLMSPLTFTQAVMDSLCPCGIQIEVRDKDWIESKKMGAFLAAAQGSCENPLFLEISYCGTSYDNKPIILCGMGITFDSGGLCLNRSENMSENRAYMAGAAVIVAVIKAIAQMSIPINILGFIPLCENMPSGMAMRPGDVVVAMNGKSIRIDRTDTVGAAILADIFSYSREAHQPCVLIDVGSYTLGTRKALGAGFTPIFSTSDIVWREFKRAGGDTGDRFWRLPMWRYFQNQVTDYKGVDVCNVGKGKGGTTCLAAAFLKEFIPDVDFAHLDVTGTGMTALDDYIPYLKKGLMTGRPTRSLIQFLYQLSCPHDREE